MDVAAARDSLPRLRPARRTTGDGDHYDAPVGGVGLRTVTAGADRVGWNFLRAAAAGHAALDGGATGRAGSTRFAAASCGSVRSGRPADGSCQRHGRAGCPSATCGLRAVRRAHPLWPKAGAVGGGVRRSGRPVVGGAVAVAGRLRAAVLGLDRERGDDDAAHLVAVDVPRHLALARLPRHADRSLVAVRLDSRDEPQCDRGLRRRRRSGSGGAHLTGHAGPAAAGCGGGCRADRRDVGPRGSLLGTGGRRGPAAARRHAGAVPQRAQVRPAAAPTTRTRPRTPARARPARGPAGPRRGGRHRPAGRCHSRRRRPAGASRWVRRAPGVLAADSLLVGRASRPGARLARARREPGGVRLGSPARRAAAGPHPAYDLGRA